MRPHVPFHLLPLLLLLLPLIPRLLHLGAPPWCPHLGIPKSISSHSRWGVAEEVDPRRQTWCCGAPIRTSPARLSPVREDPAASLPAGSRGIRDTKLPARGADFAGSKSFLLLITLPPASSHPLHPLMSTEGTRSKTATAVD